MVKSLATKPEDPGSTPTEDKNFTAFISVEFGGHPLNLEIWVPNIIGSLFHFPFLIHKSTHLRENKSLLFLLYPITGKQRIQGLA